MEEYTYYLQNPNLGLVTITTINRNIEYAENCVRIGGYYYVKNVDVYFDEITKEWTKTKNILVFDHELSIESSKKGLLYGIVAFKNGEIVEGYYSSNLLKNCKIVTGTTLLPCIDYSILDEAIYVESYSEGVYYDIRKLSKIEIGKLKKKFNKINNSDNVYNIDDNSNLFNKAIELYDKHIITVDSDIQKVARYIKGLSFGAELECISGTLPQHILSQNGIIICKDGSTKNEDGFYPPEYVTVPLKGAKGLQTLRNISLEISKRSGIDIKCSYHLHLGGMDITRVFMVSLYRLCYKIQNDVFKMFPYYKTKPEGIKEKNYCKKLLNNIISAYGSKEFNEYINNSFTDLYTFLSGGVQMDENHNIKSKNNPWGSNKWEMKTRYFWVNFVNPIFGKHDTIEFRLHSPTLNPDKIINWLLMCVAIIKFAENSTERCINLNKITFIEVLDFYKTFYKTKYTEQLSDNLIAYYKDRVDYFEKDKQANDVVSNAELLDDNNYSFSTIKI